MEVGAHPPRVSCSAKAYPEPSYEWRRHGVVIAKGNVLYIFRNMSVEDAGPYECVAFNKHGNSSAAVHVNVLCRCFGGAVRSTPRAGGLRVCRMYENAIAHVLFLLLATLGSLALQTGRTVR